MSKVSEPEPLQQIDRTCVRYQGRTYSYFSGCDYFRLASHPRVLAAASTALTELGLNVAASRLTTGNHVLYQRLERATARFFGAPDAIVVAGGYLTNLIVAQALAGLVSHAFLDGAAHPSLVDASQFLNCPVIRFKSRDSDDLARALETSGSKGRLLLMTDGMFSRDGSVAPLREYRRVLPKDSLMLVDDAHGAGVVGSRGRGSMEHAGVDRRNSVQTITFSKAFGSYGGAILGAGWLRERVLKNSRIFVGSTPCPLPLANAALTAMRTLASDRKQRTRLFDNARYLRAKLLEAGLAVPMNPGPIVALQTSNQTAAARLSRELLRAGVFPPRIRYPGAPAGGFFRFVISSEHTRAQLDTVTAVLLKYLKQLQPL